MEDPAVKFKDFVDCISGRSSIASPFFTQRSSARSQFKRFAGLSTTTHKVKKQHRYATISVDLKPSEDTIKSKKMFDIGFLNEKRQKLPSLSRKDKINDNKSKSI